MNCPENELGEDFFTTGEQPNHIDLFQFISSLVSTQFLATHGFERKVILHA